MSTAGSTYSTSFEYQQLQNARSFGARVVSEAVEQHGTISVLCPFKKHRSGHTGHEFGGGNQAILEAVALQRGYSEGIWVPKHLVEKAGGRLKKDEEQNHTRIVSGKQAFKWEDQLDEKGNKVINPETGNPEQVRKFYGEPHFFPMKVYNIAQTENYEPTRNEITPGASGLPVAVQSVWDSVKMVLPRTQRSDRLSYDIASDRLEVPPREEFREHRAATNAAFQLSERLAFAAGHPSRLDLPDFYDQGRFAAEKASVGVSTNVAAAILLQNHCRRFDPKVVELTGVAQARNLAQSLREKEIDVHLAVSQGQKLYRYLVTGPGAGPSST